VLYSNRSAAYASLCKQYISRPASHSESAALYGPDPRRLAELALEDAKKVVTLKPAWPKAHSRLGQALMLCERYREARAAFKSGLKKDPSNESLLGALKDVDALLGSDGTETETDTEEAPAAGAAEVAGAGAGPSTPGGPSPPTQPPPKRQRSTGRTVRAALDDAECSLCLKLLWEPVTTPCGHTFCKPCFARAMDHSNRCPFCRCTLLHIGSDIPVTRVLANILQKAFPQEYKERAAEEAAARAAEVAAGQGEATFTLPLFVMSTLMPGERMGLNIFEPRYRLLIRRAMEGNRRFGMAQVKASNRNALEDIAVEVEIEECTALPDGRYMLEIAGKRRVELLQLGELDGYRTARCRVATDAPPPADAAQAVAALAASVGERTDALVGRLRTWANSAGGRGARVRDAIDRAGARPPTGAHEALSFWAGTLVVSFSPSLDYEDRTRLLNMRDTRERLRFLQSALEELPPPGALSSAQGCVLM